jgi:RNA polymerase sigma-70 factor (ECF subfamily)
MITDFGATLTAAQAGDNDAVGLLWEELNHRVVRFLRVRARDAAEDIAADTWVTVAENLRRFDGSEVEFRAWLFTIANSRLVDWQRRSQRRPQIPVDPSTLWDNPTDADAADAAIAAMSTDASLELLARLPEDQATVIILRVIGDLDVCTVAKMVGKRPGAVRMLQLRGLRRLRDLLIASSSVDEEVTR